MRKSALSLVLSVILLMQAALATIPSIPVASAAGNVTINDFNSNVTKGIIPLDTRFNANVTGNVSEWQWVFYNPQLNKWSYSSVNGTTGHNFGKNGVYGVFSVTLVVSGPDGNDSLKKIDYVIANQNTTGLPTASFTASATSGNAPLKVSFTDTSTDANSTLWYFGTKDTSTEKNPTFEFTSPGTYRVVLEVSNSRGWDAIAQEIIVTGQQQKQVLPEVDFDADTSTGRSVQFIPLSKNGNAFVWTFGDGKKSIEYNPAHTYAVAGNYTVGLTVSNEYGANYINKTINVQEEIISNSESSSNGDLSETDSDPDSSNSGHSSSSGGSGSGGAGTSPEPQSNVEAKEISRTFISSGNSVSFTFPQNVTSIMKISFDSKKTTGKTTAIVETLKNQSTLVSEPPADKLYKYINIWVGNSGFATPDNIENPVVYFKVEKSWIQDKNMDKSSINLNRYNNSKWEQLSTNLSGEDDNYLYFTANTQGFSSPFAITGEMAAKEALNVTSSETQTGPNIGSLENNASNEKNVKQTPEQQATNTSTKQSKKTPGFEMISGITAMLAVFLYRRKHT
jgi:PGF-pre-PGF domain-containing protein